MILSLFLLQHCQKLYTDCNSKFSPEKCFSNIKIATSVSWIESPLDFSYMICLLGISQSRRILSNLMNLCWSRELNWIISVRIIMIYYSVLRRNKWRIKSASCRPGIESVHTATSSFIRRINNNMGHREWDYSMITSRRFATICVVNSWLKLNIIEIRTTWWDVNIIAKYWKHRLHVSTVQHYVLIFIWYICSQFNSISASTKFTRDNKMNFIFSWKLKWDPSIFGCLDVFHEKLLHAYVEIFNIWTGITNSLPFFCIKLLLPHFAL